MSEKPEGDYEMLLNESAEPGKNARRFNPNPRFLRDIDIRRLFAREKDAVNKKVVELEDSSYEDLQTVFSSLVPEDFDLGDTSESGDLVFRVITIPQDPIERKRRLDEILRKGTDRTKRTYNSGTEHIKRSYRLTATEEGLRPNDIIYCLSGRDFWQDVKDKGFKKTVTESPMGGGGNALLIIDNKTDQGVSKLGVLGSKYRFVNVHNKQKALLGIVTVSK